MATAGISSLKVSWVRGISIGSSVTDLTDGESSATDFLTDLTDGESSAADFLTDLTDGY